MYRGVYYMLHSETYINNRAPARTDMGTVYIGSTHAGDGGDSSS